MANQKRPEMWWNSKPKVKGNKVMCVAISPSGEETTDWFTLEELAAHLTLHAADEGYCNCPDGGLGHMNNLNTCGRCGGRLRR